MSIMVILFLTLLQTALFDQLMSLDILEQLYDEVTCQHTVL